MENHSKYYWGRGEVNMFKFDGKYGTPSKRGLTIR
jgi:hypothetical protein